MIRGDFILTNTKETKDWTGNYNSIYKTLGASNHTDKERQNEDYYATEPKAAELLLEVEQFTGDIWECAVGSGELANVFINKGYNVKSSDIIDRGFPNTEIINFLTYDQPTNCNIITNPPYKFAKEFVEHALNIIPNGYKVAIFLKVTFLEGKARKELFTKYPPKTIYISSSRLLCAKNADFEGMKAGGGSDVAYAWYVWEKGYTGNTVVKWIN